MSLTDGDPADGSDTWLRVITDAKYFRADGKLSNNAFSGKKTIAQPPPAPPRSWKLELSGDLLSLISDLEVHSFLFTAYVGEVP